MRSFVISASASLALGCFLGALAGCAGTGIPDSPDNGGGPLRRACFRGEFDNARRLVENGADVNLSDLTNGETPLMQAAYSGNLELVNFLVERGADLNARNRNGGSVLIHGALAGTLKASDRQAADVTRFLMRKGSRPANDNERRQVEKLLARFSDASLQGESSSKADKSLPDGKKAWWETGDKEGSGGAR